VKTEPTLLSKVPNVGEIPYSETIVLLMIISNCDLALSLSFDFSILAGF